VSTLHPRLTSNLARVQQLAGRVMVSGECLGEDTDSPMVVGCIKPTVTGVVVSELHTQVFVHPRKHYTVIPILAYMLGKAGVDRRNSMIFVFLHSSLSHILFSYCYYKYY